MDDDIITFEEGWNKHIRAGAIDKLEAMLNGETTTTETCTNKKCGRLFGPKEYMRIYDIVYQMTNQLDTDECSELLYQHHGETITAYLRNTVVPALEEREKQLLRASSNDSGGGSGGCFRYLREMSRRWQNHAIMNRWLSKFFRPLDRTYVEYRGLIKLSSVGLQLFEEHVFHETCKRDCTAAVLAAVTADRNGHITAMDRHHHRSVLRIVVNMYYCMGQPVQRGNSNILNSTRNNNNDNDNNNDNNNSNMNVYKTYLEGPFLESTRQYYCQKRVDWIDAATMTEYLRMVERCIAEEEALIAECCFHASTTGAAVQCILNDELLAAAEQALLEKESSGCRVLLQNDRRADLNRAYRLFARLPDCAGLYPIVTVFSEYVHSRGCDLLQQRAGRLVADTGPARATTTTTAAAGSAGGSNKRQKQQKQQSSNSNKAGTDDPKFIRALLELRAELLDVVKDAFCDHALFHKAVKDAFDDICNRDETTAVLLATYCDRVLKGTEKVAADQMEGTLTRVSELFLYLRDKDMFADAYRNQLAKRLLAAAQNSASAAVQQLEHDKSMISKLKCQCGTQFTSTMEGMVTDLVTGQESRRLFGDMMRQLGAGKQQQQLDSFNVQVLTTGFWPSYVSAPVTVPEELQRCMAAFMEWHGNHYQQRKLSWVLSQGYCTVRAAFANNKRYDLQVTTLQGIALETFSNTDKTYTFLELSQRLNLHESVLKPLLHSLSCGKYKVIRKTPFSNKISTTDTFTANCDFTSPNRKFRIPMPSLEPVQNARKVKEDRSLAIRAAVVRIMKARKTCPHQQLLSEVMQQLSFFKPDPRMVKQQIEALIELEYLERATDRPGVYNYLA